MNTPLIKLRQLPLLMEDLPYTEVIVLNSSIRPNGRGKEVLFSIILIEPGGGKDTWKIEKTYNNVLQLDVCMRSSVGKSASKSLMSLPEGRLWRDHAPANVDQRKVSHFCVSHPLLYLFSPPHQSRVGVSPLHPQPNLQYFQRDEQRLM